MNRLPRPASRPPAPAARLSPATSPAPVGSTRAVERAVERSVERLADELISTPGVMAGWRAAEELWWGACRSPDADGALAVLRELVDQPDDQLAVVAAIHAMSAVAGPAATAELAERLGDDRWFVTEHAAWALSARGPVDAAIAPLADMVAAGGFRGMLAQRTLAGWAAEVPARVLTALVTRLARATTSARPALADTIGVVPGWSATATLEALAAGDDAPSVRLTAVGALGWRDGDLALLGRLAAADDALGEAALLAMLDRGLRTRPPARPDARSDARLRIAQVVFHARVGGTGEHDGAGDSGGLATLVRQLSAALVDRPEVAQVTTVTWGPRADAVTDVSFGADERERFAVVPTDADVPVDRRSGWFHRLAVERGMRRVLLAGVHPDVVHLRMADVGTLAAARVARQLAVPVVFTAAPDPHVVLDQLEREGALSRRNFGHGDELEHWWFRARMVERLTTQAAQRVVLPRPGGLDELRRHFGAEAAMALDGAAVVPEGIDVRPDASAAAAVRATRAGAPAPPGGRPLLAALADLAPHRHGRPLLVSVGRLHPNKGMHRLAEAWITDPELRSETNLVLVGGDLDRPSADELDVLADLDAILGDADARRRSGAVLLGHQPNATVAHVLALAAAGLPGVVGAGGIYVAAAAKEEFGLAIVEALGAGLTVVAPAVGGPPTYVVDGDTGVLADTSRVDALRQAIGRARRLVARPGRAERARAMVRERLNVDAMAAALAAVYDRASVTGP